MAFFRLALATSMALSVYAPVKGLAQPIAGAYATRDGRASTVVIACPSSDGNFTAALCALAKPPLVTYKPPASALVATPDVPVTVFPAGSVITGCDIVNTGPTTLYIDLATTAAAGLATSIPLQPGQSFHCPYPPSGAVTAVASQQQPFVAVSY